MDCFFHQLLDAGAKPNPDKAALIHKAQSISYTQLQASVTRVAAGLAGLGLSRFDRVGVYLPKLPQTIESFFATSLAGGVFVPINPVLKAPQVEHIISDCSVSILVTSSDRLKTLHPVLARCPSLTHIVLIDKPVSDVPAPLCQVLYDELPEHDLPHGPHTDMDMAAILYTSGSTGKPKGVVLSHKNLVCGAQSVASYLEYQSDEVVLALLPLSFDYGLSQVTTALFSGGTCVLLDYLLPNDVVKAMAKHRVTGLAAVPPLWQQLMKLTWPAEATETLRFFTNSGGAMPAPTLKLLRNTFTHARPYLMYGLTEAFRSTYLPPQMVDAKPGSMGKAIPNAEVMVVRPDGSECNVDEPGELVHRGPLVSLGYWNAPEKTAARFKPVPGKQAGLMLEEIAVYSGDQVKKDAEGYLYFVGRNDEMIKTSGYRVSPMEVEDACYAASADIQEAIACGVTDSALGQAIVVVLVLRPGANIDISGIQLALKRGLPNFMHPKHIEIRDALPRNPNGKVDRSLLHKTLQETYGNE